MTCFVSLIRELSRDMQYVQLLAVVRICGVDTVVDETMRTGYILMVKDVRYLFHWFIKALRYSLKIQT